eukprot:3115102-Pleurochrysis_carterae.AAC.1
MRHLQGGRAGFLGGLQERFKISACSSSSSCIASAEQVDMLKAEDTHVLCVQGRGGGGGRAWLRHRSRRSRALATPES